MRDSSKANPKASTVKIGALKDEEAAAAGKSRPASAAGPCQTPHVLTVEEAAHLLRIGRNSAYEAIRRGEIPAIRIGHRLLVPRAALERLLQRACLEAPSAEDER